MARSSSPRARTGTPARTPRWKRFLTPSARRHLPRRRRSRRTRVREGVSHDVRSKRQFDQLLDHTQFALREAEFRRAEYWAEAGGADTGFDADTADDYRRRLWEDVIGPLPPVSLPPNPRTRLFYDGPGVRAYEVVLDVYPDVFAYGVLLIPYGAFAKTQDIPSSSASTDWKGRPQSVVDPDGPRHPYRNFAYDLAKEGFVTYAPQNPYIGQDAFRALQRKANPLGLSLFSFIVRQHEQTLAWLSSLPFVDAERIGFYGISYGGKTAMRVPALVKQYCLSICSADFNEWIWKNASAGTGTVTCSPVNMRCPSSILEIHSTMPKCHG